MFHSSQLNKLFKWIFGVSAFIIAGFCLLLLLLVGGQWKRDKQYEARLRPSIEFVESMKFQNKRLPTQNQFQDRPSAKTDWMVDLIVKDSSDSAFISHGGKTSSDYCVRIWRGETWTYYFSWTDSYDIIEP